MAFAEDITLPHHRKRKRRRQDKSAISARLVLDDHVKGDVGILSEDLFADLFPALAQGIHFCHKPKGTLLIKYLHSSREWKWSSRNPPCCNCSLEPLNLGRRFDMDSGNCQTFERPRTLNSSILSFFFSPPSICRSPSEDCTIKNI